MLRRSLEWLVCPDCSGRLRAPGTTDRIQGGALECECGRSFPIRNGVPFLLPSGVSEGPSDWDPYWSVAWNRPDPFFESKEMFERDFPGETSPAPGRRILDAACGPARDLEHWLRSKPSLLVLTDLSIQVESLAAAYDRDLGETELLIVRADLRSLPFRSRTFDVVACNRALHHVHPGMHDARDAMARCLRPGGRLFGSTYVVESTNRAVVSLAEAVKPFLQTILGPKGLLVLALFAAFFVRLATLLYRVLGSIGLSGVLPLYKTLTEFFSRYRFEWLWKVSMYDVLSAPKTHYFDGKELKEFLEAVPGSEATLWPQHDAIAAFELSLKNAKTTSSNSEPAR